MLKRFCTVLASVLVVSLNGQALRAEPFDYYVLALSWNAAWCEREGDARKADQCHPRHDHGFTLHGLWPQNEVGWPEFCRTSERDPSRAQTRDMRDIMGSPGLAWHQWKKHGRCTGLSATDYFTLSREAYSRIARPEILRKITRPMNVPPRVIEDAFIEANTGLSAGQITVTCKSKQLAEIRICLDKSLDFRACSGKVARDCTQKTVIVPPMR